jgi:hypothetical protein
MSESKVKVAAIQGLSQEVKIMFLTDDEPTPSPVTSAGTSRSLATEGGIPFIVSAKGFPVVALKELIPDPRCSCSRHRFKIQYGEKNPVSWSSDSPRMAMDE